MRRNSSSPATPTPQVDVGGGRGLYMRCLGNGSPTVVLEGGDGDDSRSYSFASGSLAEVTRTCVYDRANLGRSDPARGPRGLKDLVGNLEALLQAAKVAKKRNVRSQWGWLVLSPRAEQVVVHTGHAVEDADPQLVIDVITDVVNAAR